MSYEYSFCDNGVYGAEDLNGLVKSLVSSGVEDVFSDGVAYNASALNGIVNTLYTGGVVPETVETLRVTKQEEGLVAIAPGGAFFADGSRIRITEAELLSYAVGEKNYVYLKQDLNEQNRSYPACTTSAPTGDFVLLAEIEADGKVIDKRVYATGKVPGYQSNVGRTLVLDYDFRVGEEETSGEREFVIELGNNNYSRVFSVNGPYQERYGHIGVYSLTDGSYFCTYNVGYRAFYEANIDCLSIGGDYHSYWANLTFTQSGTQLIGHLSWNIMKDYLPERFPFQLVIC